MSSYRRTFALCVWKLSNHLNYGLVTVIVENMIHTCLSCTFAEIKYTAEKCQVFDVWSYIRHQDRPYFNSLRVENEGYCSTHSDPAVWSKKHPLWICSWPGHKTLAAIVHWPCVYYIIQLLHWDQNIIGFFAVESMTYWVNLFRNLGYSRL